MRLPIALALAVAVLPNLAVPQSSTIPEPVAADALLEQAQTEAKAQNKNVLVKFSASWCGWCHRLDDFLTKTEVGQKVKSQYIVVTLIVMENGEHKPKENPGGMDVLTRLGGAQSGIPYFAVLDPAGKTLVTSNPHKDKPGNVGFPVEDFEIAHFLTMVKTTSKLSAPDLAATESWLKENAKKIKGGQ